jgi:hypothetical protein
MAFNRVPLLGLLLAVAGCMTVKRVQPAEYIPQHNPEVVWVTYTDQSFVPVSRPKIVGDSLLGTWQGLQEPVRISLKEIQTVQARLPAPKRTALLFTVIGVSAAGALYTLATAGSGGHFYGCPRVKGTPLPDCPEAGQ